MKLAYAALAALVIATPALAEDWDVILTNRTGKPIRSIAIAPAGAGEFKDGSAYTDVPERSSVKADARTTLHFDKGPGCKHDIRATFQDDSTAVWPGFDACENAYVTLSLDKDGKPLMRAE